VTSNANQELPSVMSMIWARKKIFFAVFGTAVAAGLGYTLFAPAIWEAEATIIFPVRAPSILGAGSFDQSSLAASLTGGPTPIKVYDGILESARALAMVSAGSGLTRRQVEDMRSIQDQTMESTVTITARDRNADLAKKVVALHLQALDTINQQVCEPLASSDADVLAAKVADQQRKVDAAQQQLLAFQKTAVTAPSLAASGSGKDVTFVPATSKWDEMLHDLDLDYNRIQTSIDDVESRTHAIARLGGKLPSDLPPAQKWRDKLTDMQYDLQIQELTLAPQAPEITKLKKAIGVTQGELQSELSKYDVATSQGMVNPAEGDSAAKLSSLLTQRVVTESQIRAVRKLAALAPAEAIRLSSLSRDVSTQGAILQQLQGQYALARLQADRDPNHWQVLDEPEVEDKPVNKSFSKNLSLAALAGIALGAFAALAWPRRKPRASEPESSIDTPTQLAA